MFLQRLGRNVHKRRVSIHDPCVGNHCVESGNAMCRSEFFDGSAGVSVGATVDFDYDQGTSSAFRKGKELAGGMRVRIANTGNNGSLGVGKEGCEKTFADA